jgi:polyferredoxin
MNALQKVGTAIGTFGLLILLLAATSFNFPKPALWLSVALGAIAGGILAYSRGLYAHRSVGIQNDGVWFKSSSNRGLIAWMSGIALTAFYILLYFYPEVLGLREGNNVGIIALFDPLSKMLSGNPASQWFVYGTLYTLCIAFFGIKFFWKYRHNRYQKLRTLSVVFFQTAFAFLIPEFMARLNSESFSLPYYDLKNIWPLNYYNFYEYRIDEFISAGTIGTAMLIFGILSILVITPMLTYFYGKRWYCSWVCGCGGLAETAGDPYRHLSDKSLFAWKVERWVIHLVLVFVVLMTTAVVYSFLNDDPSKYWLGPDVFLLGMASILLLVFALVWFFKRDELKKDVKIAAPAMLLVIFGLIGIHYLFDQRLFLFDPYKLREWYGFLIGAVFSGVIGVGFYPLLGSRVWCRFGCPMAAILGMQQRFFSKFRITTNGGQCISCGNCSTYCEMGIDVKAYAQKGQNIVRSSCVGCGICSAVCPRGVLKLENKDDAGASRYAANPITFGNGEVKFNP